MDPLEDEIAKAQQEAREALARTWSQTRWTYWCTLEWRGQVSDTTATEHLERLVRDLHRTASPTIRIVVGFHADPHPHAHALIHLSRRLRARFLNAGEFTDWFRAWWYHGPVWAQDFESSRAEPGGAVTYLARSPETVTWG